MSQRRPAALLGVLVAGQILGVAMSNLIAVALPPLSKDLSPSPTQEQWIVDAYLLVFAAALTLAGALGDRFGHRRILTFGLGTFAIASLACGLVSDPGALIAVRAVQGFGPAMVLPASLALVAATHVDPIQRGRAIGIWGAGSGVGLAVGPTAGGILIDGFGWRAPFLLAAPVAILLALAALRLTPDRRPRPTSSRLDLQGGLLITAAMTGLVLAIIEGPHAGWTSPTVLTAAALACLLLIAFLAAERRHPDPLIDLAVLSNRVFAAANLAAGALVFAMLGVSVYLSNYLQNFQDASPLTTGLALAPTGIATAGFAVFAGRLTTSLPRSLQITSGLLLACLALGLLSQTGPHTTAAMLCPALLLLGAGAGIALPATTATAVEAVPVERAGMGSAIHNATRQVGGTLGVAALGSIIAEVSTNPSAASYAQGLRVGFLATGALLLTVAVLTVRSLRVPIGHPSGT